MSWIHQIFTLGWDAAINNFFFLEDFIYLEGKGRRKRGRKNISVWLPLMHTLLGTWPTTQAGALTRSPTHDPLFHRPALNPLSNTSGEKSATFIDGDAEVQRGHRIC